MEKNKDRAIDHLKIREGYWLNILYEGHQHCSEAIMKLSCIRKLHNTLIMKNKVSDTELKHILLVGMDLRYDRKK